MIHVSTLLSLSRRFLISFKEQFENRKELFLLWLMMANIHYNHTKTLEKRETTIVLWTSGSKQSQIADEVGLSPETVFNIVTKFLQRGTYLPGKPDWKERAVSTPDVVEFAF